MYMDDFTNSIERIFGNYDRPFKEIEQYKLYRKDEKGYLLVVNALGLDRESLNVTVEKNGVNGAHRMPILSVVGKKKNKITGSEYSINLRIALTIKEEIEDVLYDCVDGVCVINITIKDDPKAKFTAKQLPEEFVW